MGYTDITPPLSPGRQIIESYGGGGFKVAGTRWTGSVLIFPEQTLAWPVNSAAAISRESLQPVIDRADRVRILIIGCGAGCLPGLPTLDQELRALGLSGIEWMSTGPACRTLNVLLLEGREVAAALIAVD